VHFVGSYHTGMLQAYWKCVRNISLQRQQDVWRTFLFRRISEWFVVVCWLKGNTCITTVLFLHI